MKAIWNKSRHDTNPSPDFSRFLNHGSMISIAPCHEAAGIHTTNVVAPSTGLHHPFVSAGIDRGAWLHLPCPWLSTIMLLLVLCNSQLLCEQRIFTWPLLRRTYAS